MAKRVFNKRTGHYQVMNEAEAQEQTKNKNNQQQSQSNNSQDDKKEENQTGGKLETDEVYQKLMTTLNDLERQYNQKTTPIKVQRQKLVSEISSRGVDPELSSKVIQLDNLMLKDRTDFNNKVATIKRQIIARRDELKVESFNTFGIPGKYHNMLLEANLEPHKVYLNELFDDFDTFHKIFEHSNLLYGEDDENVFVLIESYDDVNEARELLYRAGFYEHYIDMAFDPLIEKQEPNWFLI